MDTRVYCCLPLRILDCSSEYNGSAYSERHEYLYLEIALEWSAAARIAVVNPDFTPQPFQFQQCPNGATTWGSNLLPQHTSMGARSGE